MGGKMRKTTGDDFFTRFGKEFKHGFNTGVEAIGGQTSISNDAAKDEKDKMFRDEAAATDQKKQAIGQAKANADKEMGERASGGLS